MVLLRFAQPSDAARILDIYAPFVLNTTISFEYRVPTVYEMEARIAGCLLNFPWIVCEIDEMLAGYAYASKHREREAYQWTCECSVYLHTEFKRKGIARILYEELFGILKSQGLVNVYAGITLPNEASVRFHEKCGFEFFALYENIGFKFGKWHKVGWWKHQLHNYTLSHAPPLKFSQMDRQILEESFRAAALRIATNLND